jgi:hypothetical protein
MSIKKHYKTPRRLKMKAFKYLWETILLIGSYYGLYIPSYLNPKTYMKNEKVKCKEEIKEYIEKQKIDVEIKKQASL